MSAKNSFDTQYSFALQRILAVRPMKNRRTGKNVKAIDGLFFRTGEIPILNLRDIKPLWTAAESVWFLGGRSDVKFMRDFGFKNWDAFTDKAGKMILSATGYRWRFAHGVDQLQAVIDKLNGDLSSRQAVLISWSPAEDLLKPGPNVPCLIAWHLHYINGQLHMTVMQRSADMYFGFPHDILGARIVQEVIAAAVEVPPGNLAYAISNGHLYEDQWDTAKDMIAREETCTEVAKYPESFKMTQEMVKGALAGNPDTVKLIMKRVDDFYRPFPPLSGPKLVA